MRKTQFDKEETKYYFDQLKTQLMFRFQDGSKMAPKFCLELLDFIDYLYEKHGIILNE